MSKNEMTDYGPGKVRLNKTMNGSGYPWDRNPSLHTEKKIIPGMYDGRGNSLDVVSDGIMALPQEKGSEAASRQGLSTIAQVGLIVAGMIRGE